MEKTKLSCKDCMYLANLGEDKGAYGGPESEDWVALCAIQSNMRPMLFRAAELQAARHPLGICQDGDLMENSGLVEDATCYAFQSKGAPIEILASHRRDEMTLIHRALHILQMHNMPI